jgi:putative acyl-CoA dehydrogenase
MRQALTLALNHAQTRRGFGSSLADQPMMTNILADLAIDAEACTLLAFRVARGTDAMATSDTERRLARIATPLAKFWNCKRAPAFVAEALECHGGNGFIEENAMARLYREAPLNGIWEGTSNMMCMDVLRGLRREAGTGDAFMDEVMRAKGADKHLDRWLDRLGTELAKQHNDDSHARRLCRAMAYALQASQLHDHGSPHVFEAFCRSRLHEDGHTYGALDGSPELKRILERATVLRH